MTTGIVYELDRTSSISYSKNNVTVQIPNPIHFNAQFFSETDSPRVFIHKLETVLTFRTERGKNNISHMIATTDNAHV